jgi:hypothetical protein
VRNGTAFDRNLIAPMVLGAILNPINFSMIAVALVPIGLAFGASPSATAWLVSGLYLATATGQPVVGRLVDRYAPRRLYLVATALVGVAGVLGVTAPTLGVLVAARVLLGLGTCADLRAFLAEVPQLNQWDDHEVLNNWYPGEILDDARYTEKRVDVLPHTRSRRSTNGYRSARTRSTGGSGTVRCST